MYILNIHIQNMVDTQMQYWNLCIYINIYVNIYIYICVCIIQRVWYVNMNFHMEYIYICGINIYIYNIQLANCSYIMCSGIFVKIYHV